MSTQALPNRFINSPTVMESYQQEHPESPVDLSDEEVEELSNEYNKVSGNEGYYKLLFEHLRPQQEAITRAGNEGLVSWTKSAIGSFIDAIKKFFKWIWSFFFGKAKQLEKKSEALEDDLKAHGVKDGDIPYPMVYTQLWADPKPVPKNLDWMKTFLAKLNKALDAGIAHAEAMQAFCNNIKSVLIVSQSEQRIGDYIKNHHNKVHGIFKGFDTSFVGIAKAIVGDNGKVVIVNNPKLLKKQANPTFKTNVTAVENLRKEADKAAEKFETLLGKTVGLEKNLIKSMEESLTFAQSLNLEKGGGKTEALINKVKRVASDYMVTVKSQDLLFMQLTKGALDIIAAAIATSSKKKDDNK